MIGTIILGGLLVLILAREKIREFVTADKKYPFDNSFIYPYSSEPEKRTIEVWKNLEKGLLFEDERVLVPWGTPFSHLHKYSEDRKVSPDRTEWFFGTRKIFDGYFSNLETMNYRHMSDTEPLDQVDEDLGAESIGYSKFLYLKTHLTSLLGEPNKCELKEFDEFQIGQVVWVYKNVVVRLSGFEYYTCRYSLIIGYHTDIQ